MKFKIALTSLLTVVTTALMAQTATFDGEQIYQKNDEESHTVYFGLIADETQQATVEQNAESLENVTLIITKNDDESLDCEVTITGTAMSRQILKKYMMSLGIMQFIYNDETYDMNVLDRVAVERE